MQQDRQELLTAHQVQCMFGVDRSTVYRMAARGALPAVKVGRQWRFPAHRIAQLQLLDGSGTVAEPPQHAAGALPVPIAEAVVAVSAALLGVTMVVTDMQGRPLTGLANACGVLSDASDDPGAVAACLGEWRALADELDLEPQFRRGPMGFECARAFVRAGTELIAMVVAGGVAPPGEPADGLHDLDPHERDAVLAALPRIAATLSRAATGRPIAEFAIDLEHRQLVSTSTYARSSARSAGNPEEATP